MAACPHGFVAPTPFLSLTVGGDFYDDYAERAQEQNDDGGVVAGQGFRAPPGVVQARRTVRRQAEREVETSRGCPVRNENGNKTEPLTLTQDDDERALPSLSATDALRRGSGHERPAPGTPARWLIRARGCGCPATCRAVWSCDGSGATSSRLPHQDGPTGREVPC